MARPLVEKNRLVFGGTRSGDWGVTSVVIWSTELLIQVVNKLGELVDHEAVKNVCYSYCTS